MSRDLLKEAIADAKAVKEAAIANAKAALEEAFTPQLKELLAAKLEVLEEGADDSNIEEGEENETSMEEATLEEILAELEEATTYTDPEGKDEHRTQRKVNNRTPGELDNPYDKGVNEAKEDSEEGDSEEGDEEPEEGSEDKTITDEFSEPEIEAIKKLIEKELEMMMGEEGGSEEDTEDDMADLANAEEDENINLEELMLEMEMEKKPMEEGWQDILGVIRAGGDYVKIAPMLVTALGIGGAAALINTILNKFPDVKEKLGAIASGAAGAINRTTGTEPTDNDTTRMDEELEEAYSTIETLRSDLNEVNLLNAKLLYTNKIFKAKNLTESQKVKVLSTFDKAETINEVKLVFESLSTTINTTTNTTKAPIKESMGFASKASGVVKQNQTIETDAVIARMKKLAGL